MTTEKITSVQLVSQGRVVLSLEKGKKVLLDKDSIATAQLLGIKIASGASVTVSDSVNPVTSEVSDTWAVISF